MTDLRGYLTLKQASRKYGWPRSTLDRWCRQGLLPAVQIGGGQHIAGMWLIREEDVRRFVRPRCGPKPRQADRR